jgi:Neprosin
MDASPHLFIFSTNDGYNTTGCYNDLDGPLGCIPWVQLSSKYVAGMELPMSVLGGDQHELMITTSNLGAQQGSDPNQIATGWGVYIGVDGDCCEELGYYPSSNYSGQMQFGASYFRVGGEVDSVSGEQLPMGSGMPASAGYLFSAYHRNVATVQTVWVFYPNSMTWMSTPSNLTPDPYTYSTVTAGGNGWQSYFYFGGN